MVIIARNTTDIMRNLVQTVDLRLEHDMFAVRCSSEGVDR